MGSPNAWARCHGQSTPGTCSSPRINKQAPKYYAPPMDGFPVTSGGTTAIAKGGQTPTGKVAQQPPLVCQLSFATPLAVPAGNSVSSLSQSTTRGNVMVPPLPILIRRRLGLSPPKNPILEEETLIPLTMMKMTRN